MAASGARRVWPTVAIDTAPIAAVVVTTIATR
jgi:hypothetical protein